MRILLTNDDGIKAAGLYELYKKLYKKFKVVVCAPHTQKSAIGHAITLNKPLRMKKVYRDNKFFGYAVNGTPADCVKIAVRSIFKSRPQLVISGINHGPNLGSDIMYSGTVSAACEGTILGIPSMAISLATYKNDSFKFAVDFAYNMAKLLEKTGLPDGILLNINIPAIAKSRIRGVVITKQGRSLYKENFIKRSDSRGETCYWLEGKVKWLKKQRGSDIKAIEDKHISITPLQFDLTAYKFIPKLKKVEFRLNEVIRKFC